MGWTYYVAFNPPRSSAEHPDTVVRHRDGTSRMLGEVFGRRDVWQPSDILMRIAIGKDDREVQRTTRARAAEVLRARLASDAASAELPEDLRDIPAGSRPCLAGQGSHAPLDDRHRSLLEDYPGATPARRQTIAETLGQLGGLQYLQDATGDADLSILHPTSDTDVADLARAVDEGRAWPTAVAFGRSRAFDLVHFNGTTLRTVETTGGDGRYGAQGGEHTGSPHLRIRTVHTQHVLDTAHAMARSTLIDGRRGIGAAIQQGIPKELVEHTVIRVGPREALVQGRADVIVDLLLLVRPPRRQNP